MRKRAIVRVSDAVIKALLQVRADLDVIDVVFNRMTGEAEILFGGAGLPELSEGCVPLAFPLERLQ